MVQIIAEIGCNHKGQLDIAKTMIEIAKTSGANIAKFQKRNNKNFLQKRNMRDLISSKLTHTAQAMVNIEKS